MNKIKKLLPTAKIEKITKSLYKTNLITLSDEIEFELSLINFTIRKFRNIIYLEKI